MFEIYKKKAEKWDALEEKVSGAYGEDVDGEFVLFDDDDERGGDLETIGLHAATAFGWLN